MKARVYYKVCSYTISRDVQRLPTLNSWFYGLFTVNMAIQQVTIVLLLVLTLGTMVISSASASVSISPVVTPGDGVAEFPSDEERQDTLQMLKSRTEQILQSYYPNCGPGLWRQVVLL